MDESHELIIIDRITQDEVDRGPSLDLVSHLSKDEIFHKLISNIFK